MVEMWEQTLQVLEHKLPAVFAGLSKLYVEKYKKKVRIPMSDHTEHVHCLAYEHQQPPPSCGAGDQRSGGQEYEQRGDLLPVLQGEAAQAGAGDSGRRGMSSAALRHLIQLSDFCLEILKHVFLLL